MKQVAGTILTFTIGILVVASCVDAEANYTLSVTDDKGTVFIYTGEDIERVEGHDDIDITKLRSYKQDEEVILELTVAGNIKDNDSYYYDIEMDTTCDGEEDFTLEYENGTIVFCDEADDEEYDVNFSVDGGVLKISIPAELFGEPVDFDLSAKTTEYSDDGYYDILDWIKWIEPKKESDDSPGFEGMVAVFSLLMCTIILRKRRR